MVTSHEHSEAEERIVDVLDEDCSRVSRLLARLDDEQLEWPTRLSPWSVVELVAHLFRMFERVPVALASGPLPGPPECDAATYWDGYEPRENAARTQDRVRRIMARHDTDRSAILAFDSMWREAVTRLRTADLDAVVSTWAPAMTLADFARTRTVEIVVHGMDLTDAVHLEPVASDDGLAVVVDILRRRLGAELPDELTWTQVEWAEKGTGRTSLDRHDHRVLGHLATRFPLIR
jgi:uncharacterized protein (TIGR03083 family)